MSDYTDWLNLTLPQLLNLTLPLHPDPSHSELSPGQRTALRTSIYAENTQLELIRAHLSVASLMVSDRLKYNQVYAENLPIDYAGPQTAPDIDTESFTPIRKLPPELLCKVFDFACEFNVLREIPWHLGVHLPAPQSRDSHPTLLPALVLSCTCRQWRDIAVSTPSLWSGITLQFTSCFESPKARNSFTDLLELYLSRSQPHPLDIRLSVYGSVQADQTLVLSSVLQHCRRWGSITCEGDLSFGSLVPPTQSYDQLRSVDIRMQKGLETQWDISSRLKSLSILNLTPPTRQRSPHLQLNSLELFANSHLVLDLPDLFPSLHTLTMWESSDDNERFTYDKLPVRTFSSDRPFRSLRVLRLHLADSRYHHFDLLKAMLTQFVFPSLRELRLETISPAQAYTRVWPKQQFQRCIERSGWQLTKLVLLRISLDDIDVLSALMLQSSLEELVISDESVERGYNSPITTTLISSLSRRYDSRLQLVPRLRFLELEYHGDYLDDGELVDAILSRSTRSNPDQLRSVVLRFPNRRVDHSAYQKLYDFDLVMGMQVVVIGMEDC